MVNRATKLRWRRRLRKKQKQALELGTEAEKQLENNFIRRLGRLEGVRRFLLAWVLLIMFLVGGLVLQTRGLARFYQVLEPGVGGVFTEGIYGSFTNANPIYAVSSVDASVSRLVFSSLMTYDARNRLVGDLAESIDVNETGSEYTVVLKQDIFWHDGMPVTADDVVFTYSTIQKPNARSPFLANWKNVEIVAKNKQTVVFTLPGALASFPHSLTNGIVPKHKLGGVSPSSMRSASFNTVNPVGSGPFKWDTIKVEGDTSEDRQERIGLVANQGYYDGPPNVERFNIRAYHNIDQLESDLEASEISAAAGLEKIPEAAKNSLRFTEYNVPLAAQTMVFMKNSAEPFEDERVRQALAYATNTEKIIAKLGYPVVVSDAPLLKSHTGYNEKLTQKTGSLKLARALLQKADWKFDDSNDGVRFKRNKPLRAVITTLDNEQYKTIAEELERQWERVGVEVTVQAQDDDSLQSALSAHSYDILLYGITLGSDPDVYAYWHSSQADPLADERLNFAEYKSTTADAALSAGRSRLGNKLRKTKYEPFLKAWRDDMPAIALFQPRYLYVTQGTLFGFEPVQFNTPTDRYANVTNWAVRQDRVNIY